MDDLISRKALIKELERLRESNPHSDARSRSQHNSEITSCIHRVNIQPTVEAVPVIRCKNCKHWHEETAWCNKHSHFIDCEGGFCHPWESGTWKMFDENDYCSDGERRENEIN